MKRRKEYRKRGAAAGQQKYTITQLAERDGWRCHLCNQPVLKTKKVPHHKAPTVDHLVPISAGGIDAMENVALAHFICNARRGASGPAQLILIG